MSLTAFNRSQARLDRTIRPWFIAALAVCLVHWAGLLAFLVTRLGTLDFLRLHYTAEFGIDWMGDWYLIFTYPATGLVILIINVLMALVLQKTHRSLTPQVAIATLAMQVIVAVAGAIAIYLNR